MFVSAGPRMTHYSAEPSSELHIQVVCQIGSIMGYEIDFLPVGDESKGGDAIALRYGNLFGSRDEQVVMVVDGGYTDDGEALVQHIRQYYGTNRVDIVVSTHPDQDHITGLKIVLEEMEVGALLMHQPWKHSGTVSEARKSSFRSRGLVERVEKSFQAASDLETIANRKGVKIFEPFGGFQLQTTAGDFRVLGPTKEYYEGLLTTETQAPPDARSTFALQEVLKALAASAVTLLAEGLNLETLRDDGQTTPTNNSSVICSLTVDDKRLLLTGDAGIPALEQAMAVLEAEGLQPGSFNLVQVPHHGSRRNVGPSILNRVLGPKGQTALRATAVASVPPKNPEHKFPAKKVTNAFRRRGYQVLVTAGVQVQFGYDAPAREGWTTATPLPFYEKVEEDSGT
jgi:beta-lactamase superfamily II metal-dependent hydrolase